MEIDLDKLTSDVIEASDGEGHRPDGYGRWEMVFDVLKVALGDPTAVAPQFRTVMNTEWSIYDGLRKALNDPEPSPIIDGTKIVVSSVFEMLTEVQRRALIDAVHELAIGTDDADEQIGPFVRGFFRAFARN